MVVAGCCLLAAGAAVPAWTRAATGLATQAAGAAFVGAGGILAFAAGSTAGSGFTSDFRPHVGVDPLSGFFLGIMAIVAVPATIYAVAYLRQAPDSRALASLNGLFLLALTGLLVARDVALFLACWELMTLVPAATILLARRDPPARRSVFEYLAVTHIGGAGVWVALLILAERGALGDRAGLAGAGAGVQALVGIAGIIGFGTKAGLVPLHSWLPRAHPLAPSNTSALMSGVMVKLPLYGLARLVFEWLGAPRLWIGIVLLVAGAASGLIGVLYALFQHELKRLLAFHTIENVGIIVGAFGAAVLLSRSGEVALAAVAYAAAALHTANHAVFKGLLFLGAGAFERAAGGVSIDRLGGLLHRMPWTGGAFAVGAVAIAGLPPLNGFISEWLALQALLGMGRSDSLGIALAGGLGAAALGTTAALALLCFAKVVGLALLGRPRTPATAGAVEAPRPMRAATGALAALCVALGVAPGLLMPAVLDLAPGRPVVGLGLGVAAPGTHLPAAGIALALAAAAGVLVIARRRTPTPAPAPAWTCGQDVVPELGWTSAAFTKPLRLALWGVLRPEREVTARVEGGLLHEVRYRGAVPHLFDRFVYAPVLRGAMAAAAFARRLQSGSLRRYVTYLVSLVIIALTLARAGALG